MAEDDVSNNSLYSNFSYLIQFHQPSKEFKNLLKENMFERTNKAGMLYTFHFLLPIFKKNVFKGTIHWPVHTLKDEALFRGAVLKFITEYNSTHNVFQLPKILNSILSSAGGPKFKKFMLDLTNAALMVTLKEQADECKNTLSSLKSLDNAEKLSIIAQSEAEFNEEDEKLEQFIQLASTYQDEYSKELDFLEKEIERILSVLKKSVNANNFLTEAEKKSVLDLENDSVMENYFKQQEIKKNVLKVKMEQIREMKEIINGLYETTQMIVYAKENPSEIDGSKFKLSSSPFVNELVTKNFLDSKLISDQNRKHSFDDLLVFAKASSKFLLNQLQNKASSDFLELSNHYENSTECLSEIVSNSLELEASLKEEIFSVKASIEELEEKLFDFSIEPDPRFVNVLAPSPPIFLHLNRNEPRTQCSFKDSPVDSPVDSPFIKNYAKRLIEKLKADAIQKNGNNIDDVKEDSFKGSVVNQFSKSNLKSRLPIYTRSHLKSKLSCTNENSTPNVHKNNFHLSSNFSFKPNGVCKKLISCTEDEDLINFEVGTMSPLENDDRLIDTLPPDNFGDSLDSDCESPMGLFSLGSGNKECDKVDFDKKTPKDQRKLTFSSVYERYKKSILFSDRSKDEIFKN